MQMVTKLNKKIKANISIVITKVIPIAI